MLKCLHEPSAAAKSGQTPPARKKHQSLAACQIMPEYHGPWPDEHGKRCELPWTSMRLLSMDVADTQLSQLGPYRRSDET